MAPLDNDKPSEPVIFKRGNPGTTGQRFPASSGDSSAPRTEPPFSPGQWSSRTRRDDRQPDNPLTARVAGEPGVAALLIPAGRDSPATSAFGAIRPRIGTARPPRRLVHGYDLVAQTTFHRTSCSRPPIGSRAIPERIRPCRTASHTTDVGSRNVLLWRMNRKRTDFEALRDSLLAVSGRLDSTLGGQPVPMYEGSGSPRRTLYGFIDRQNLPGLYARLISPVRTPPRRCGSRPPHRNRLSSS